MAIDPRARTAGLVGLAGAILAMVAWALALRNPADGTSLWYASNAVGEVAMVGFVALLLGMILVREAGRGVVARTFLTLWLLGTVVLLAGGVVSLFASDQNTLLFPVGGILSTLAGLVASIFIAFNKAVPGLRRWAPLIYVVGGVIAGFFEGDQHTLQVNLADLANNLLTLFLAATFFLGLRGAAPVRPVEVPAPAA